MKFPVKISLYSTFLTAIVLILISCTPKTTHPSASWIIAGRNGNGGFGCYPGDYGYTSRTGMALLALRDLGALDRLENKKELVSWLLARQNPDGGFYESENYYSGSQAAGVPEMPWASSSGLQPTLWAVRALKILGKEIPNKKKIAGFVNKLSLIKFPEKNSSEEEKYCLVPIKEEIHAPFSSFEASAKKGFGTLYSAYWALSILKEIGRELPPPEQIFRYMEERCVRWSSFFYRKKSVFKWNS
ncbi:MAG: prenyltransferase/squalene oxidase repeat-containing protein, partial [Fibrobacterota bacterium]